MIESQDKDLHLGGPLLREQTEVYSVEVTLDYQVRLFIYLFIYVILTLKRC